MTKPKRKKRKQNFIETDFGFEWMMAKRARGEWIPAADFKDLKCQAEEDIPGSYWNWKRKTGYKTQAEKEQELMEQAIAQQLLEPDLELLELKSKVEIEKLQDDLREQALELAQEELAPAEKKTILTRYVEDYQAQHPMLDIDIEPEFIQNCARRKSN